MAFLYKTVMFLAELLRLLEENILIRHNWMMVSPSDPPLHHQLANACPV